MWIKLKILLTKIRKYSPLLYIYHIQVYIIKYYLNLLKFLVYLIIYGHLTFNKSEIIIIITYQSLYFTLIFKFNFLRSKFNFKFGYFHLSFLTNFNYKSKNIFFFNLYVININLE